jgi:hypothetical protein
MSSNLERQEGQPRFSIGEETKEGVIFLARMLSLYGGITSSGTKKDDPKTHARAAVSVIMAFQRGKEFLLSQALERPVDVDQLCTKSLGELNSCRHPTIALSLAVTHIFEAAINKDDCLNPVPLKTLEGKVEKVINELNQ